MPHQCTYCSKIYPDAAEELLKGCECGSRFFYYIKQEKYDELKNEVKNIIAELEKSDKKQIEKDIRELTGLDEKPDQPVILDLESVRVIKPGKFEIDIVNLFSRKRPIIYKLGEGKYIIDIASSLNKVETTRKDSFVSRIQESDHDKDVSEEEKIELENDDNENI